MSAFRRQRPTLSPNPEYWSEMPGSNGRSRGPKPRGLTAPLISDYRLASASKAAVPLMQSVHQRLVGHMSHPGVFSKYSSGRLFRLTSITWCCDFLSPHLSHRTIRIFVLRILAL